MQTFESCFENPDHCDKRLLASNTTILEAHTHAMPISTQTSSSYRFSMHIHMQETNTKIRKNDFYCSSPSLCRSLANRSLGFQVLACLLPLSKLTHAPI